MPSIMNITLDNFQDFIPSRIYWRGVDYQESGAVTQLQEKSAGTWHATVLGTGNYNVTVRIGQNGALTWSCDCPYDGSMCKHVVATLLEINDHTSDNDSDDDEFEDDYDADFEIVFDDDDSDDNDDDGDDTSLSSDPELERLLALATVNDLKAFIRQRSTSDSSLRRAVIEHLQSLYLDQPDDVAIDYEQKVDMAISSCIATHRARYGYYEATDWEEVVGQANDLLDEGENLLKAGNARAAVAIAVQLFKSMDKMADESIAYEEESDIGGVCDRAGNLLLQAIVKPGIDSDSRSSVLESIKALTSSELCDYNYCNFDNLLQQLTMLTLQGDDAIKFVDQIIASHAGKYSQCDYIKQKIDLLEQLGRHDEAERTIDQYIETPQIRQLRVDRLVAAQHYEEALRVIDDGIAVAIELQHNGTAADWTKRKLTIYEALGDTEQQIKVCRELFVRRSDIERYRKLRSLIPAKQWPQFLAKLLTDAGLVINGYSDYRLAEILIEEGDHDKLFDYVSQIKKGRLDEAIRCAIHLRNTHSKQLLALLQQDIRDYAATHVGESHYRKLADALRVVGGLPNCRAAAAALRTELCSTYARRRRMVEILRE